jgi:two-component system chemotaxis response regulator CheB
MTTEPPTPGSAIRIPNSGQLRVPSSAFRVVVIGASAGGGEALAKILSKLPADYGLPILVVQHLHPRDDGGFAEHLDREIGLTVVAPCDKQKIERGRIYIAPANYHMLVERNGAIALSTEGRVNWSRPSIDVLFESAARAWEEGVIAILLSGANADGAEGMGAVRAAGGVTIAHDPASAQGPVMPQAAIDAGVVDKVMTLEGIWELLIERGTRNGEGGTVSSAEHGTRNGERGRENGSGR